MGSQLLESGQKMTQMSEGQRSVMKKGQEIYSTICAACHGPDGKGSEVAGLKDTLLAPPLAGSKILNGDPHGGIYVLLKGLQGEIEGKKYEGLMIPMGGDDDEWIASVLSFIRNSFGNSSGFVEVADVAQARKDTRTRNTPWTYDELMGALPRYVPSSRLKVSASDKSADAAKAIDGRKETRYTSGKFMRPGMWFQIELAEPMSVAGVTLDTRSSAADYPRGCDVAVSADGNTWTSVLKKAGDGSFAVTELGFQPVRTKFIRITQTGSAERNFWSIHELKVRLANQ